jgi:hypothetical protein
MAASSPPRAAYYVQSPSHDDGENKTSASSFHSSPAASPPRSASRHSSSSSRFSASAKGTASVAGGVPTGGGRRRGSAWAKEAAIEEEGLLGVDDGGGGDGDGRGGIPRRARYLLGFAGAFLGLFLLFALVLWGASRNQRPVVALRAVTFHRFVVQAGTDASLVPTEMASLNATVSLTFRNAGTFFGVHVSADPVTLHYAQLQLASGNVRMKRESVIIRSDGSLLHYVLSRAAEVLLPAPEEPAEPGGGGGRRQGAPVRRRGGAEQHPDDAAAAEEARAAGGGAAAARAAAAGRAGAVARVRAGEPGQAQVLQRGAVQRHHGPGQAR